MVLAQSKAACSLGSFAITREYARVYLNTYHPLLLRKAAYSHIGSLFTSYNLLRQEQKP